MQGIAGKKKYSGVAAIDTAMLTTCSFLADSLPISHAAASLPG